MLHDQRAATFPHSSHATAVTPKPKTSETDPIRVDFVAPDVVPPPGRIGLTFAPGKQDPAARTGAWDRDLSADLQHLRSRFGTDMAERSRRPPRSPTCAPSPRRGNNRSSHVAGHATVGFSLQP